MQFSFVETIFKMNLCKLVTYYTVILNFQLCTHHLSSVGHNDTGPIHISFLFIWNDFDKFKIFMYSSTYTCRWEWTF